MRPDGWELKVRVRVPIPAGVEVLPAKTSRSVSVEEDVFAVLVHVLDEGALEISVIVAAGGVMRGELQSLRAHGIKEGQIFGVCQGFHSYRAIREIGGCVRFAQHKQS